MRPVLRRSSRRLPTLAAAVAGFALLSPAAIAAEPTDGGAAEDYTNPVIVEEARLIPAKPPAPTSPPPGAKAPAPKLSGVPGDTVIAEGIGVRITAAEFAANLAEMSPSSRSIYENLDRRRKHLDYLILMELERVEARRIWPDWRPARADAPKDAIVTALDEAVTSAAEVPAPSEAELRAAFAESRKKPVSPERIRVEIFRIQVLPHRPRQEAAAAAEWFRARIAPDGRPPDRDTVHPWFERGGPGAYREPDDGLLTLEQLADRYGQPLATASFALTKVGDVTPILESPWSFDVAELVERQPARYRTEAEVRAELTERAAMVAKVRAWGAFMARLRTEAHVRVDEDALARIVVK